MCKEKILEILENAKDGNGAVPMRLVRTAFDKLPEPCEDAISRQEAIDVVNNVDNLDAKAKGGICITLMGLSSIQPEYEPVTAEDFAKTMSENTLWHFISWHNEALTLMERYGFVICKKVI